MIKGLIGGEGRGDLERQFGACRQLNEINMRYMCVPPKRKDYHIRGEGPLHVNSCETGDCSFIHHFCNNNLLYIGIYGSMTKLNPNNFLEIFS